MLAARDKINTQKACAAIAFTHFSVNPYQDNITILFGTENQCSFELVANMRWLLLASAFLALAAYVSLVFFSKKVTNLFKTRSLQGKIRPPSMSITRRVASSQDLKHPQDVLSSMARTSQFTVGHCITLE